MLMWKPPFAVSAASLLATVWVALLASTPVASHGQDPLLTWFSRFSTHETVRDAVVSSLYLDFSPMRVERLGARPADSIFLEPRTALNDALWRRADLPGWIERHYPGHGAELTERLFVANRHRTRVHDRVTVSARVRRLTPTQADSVRADRAMRSCREAARGSAVGPLALSVPALSGDSTLALVYAEEPWRYTERVGTFVLLERGRTGWRVSHWWTAWVAFRDSRGELREVHVRY